MQKMAGYEKVREWWDITDGMQVRDYPSLPLYSRVWLFSTFN